MFSTHVAHALVTLSLASIASAQCDPVERAKVLANDGAGGDIFGYVLAMDGDTAVIGAHNDDTPAGLNAGSAYVFVREGGIWQQQAQLFASNAAPNRMFGWSVAISGNTIVVGSNAAMSAYVFVRTGSMWTEQARLTASDGVAGDGFGESVAIDGDTIIVGAHLDDVMGLEDFGSAYIFVRAGTQWSEQAHVYNPTGPEYGEFGDTVAISGDTVLISAHTEDTPVAVNPGAVHVVTRSGATWTMRPRFYASNGASGDHFGAAIAVAGNLAVIGAENDDTSRGINAGSVYVFERTGDTWLQLAQLSAADGAANDWFGHAVALGEGRILVGAANDNTASGSDAGSVYLFTRTGSAWTERAKLTAADGAADDYFGNTVAIDGDAVLIGAYTDDNARGMNAGSVYVFDVNGDCCAADFDEDGFVTGVDYDQFVAAFEAGEESADFDGDSFITGLDFDAYVVAFEAGC